MLTNRKNSDILVTYQINKSVDEEDVGKRSVQRDGGWCKPFATLLMFVTFEP